MNSIILYILFIQEIESMSSRKVQKEGCVCICMQRENNEIPQGFVFCIPE